MQREKGNPRDLRVQREMGPTHRTQIFLNLQLLTKPLVQPQEQKSVVREGYELMSLDLQQQERGVWGMLMPPDHYSSTFLGKSLL